MAGRRIAAVLSLAAALGCIDPTAERSRRDFEECGRAELGEVRARIDPGVALAWTDADGPGPGVRFRANAPAVELTLESSSAEARAVSVRIDNLPPDAVLPPGASLLEQKGKSLRFSVALPAGGRVALRIAPAASSAAGPFRFAWVGDVQGGVERFGRIREAIDADGTFDFVLFAGDVTASGSDREIAEFVAAADRLERPWYAVIGNHDTTFGREEAFQAQIGRLNYGFDWRGARFLLLDTASATLDDRAWGLAREQLGPGEPRLRVVGLHVPPLDFAGMRDAGFASRAEGAKLIELLAAGGVDLMLAGHLHTLQFSRFGGVEAVVSGNGGVGAEDRLDGMGLHYLAIEADPAAESLRIGTVRLE